MSPEDRPPDETPAAGGITQFAGDLAIAITNARVYRSEHPRVRSVLESLTTGLQSEVDAIGRDSIEIGGAGGYLVFDRRPLIGAGRVAPRLLGPLAEIGSGGLAFDQGATDEDFLALIQLLARGDLATLDVEGANVALASAGCRRIRLLPPYVTGDEEPAADLATQMLGEDETADDESALRLDVPLMLYRDVFDHLTDTVMQVLTGNYFRVEETKGFVEVILQRLEADAARMLSVSHYTYAGADEFDFGHSIRVACLAIDFLRSLTSDESLIHRVGTAALLHDVGKARVDRTVRHAKGPLDEEQRREMQRHTEYGAEILLEVEQPDPLCIAVALDHHRTTDGRGYPDRLHTAPLSTATRIVKICDVYEALTARRPYKRPMSPVNAYRLMLSESMQHHFDGTWLHRFIRINGLYPIGETVLLASGATATVVRRTAALTRPVIRLLDDADEVPRGAAEAEIDLSRLPDDDPSQILRALVAGEPEGDSRP